MILAPYLTFWDLRLIPHHLASIFCKLSILLIFSNDIPRLIISHALPVCGFFQMSSLDGQLLSDPAEYRHLVASIQYLTFTRPDISFVVNHVAQFMSTPRSPHLVAAKHILRYLKGSLGFGLSFGRSHGPLTLCGFNTLFHTLHGFSDADWASCPDTRHSTTGFCVFLGPNIIFWSAKKQHTVSHSSAEAEYRSLAHVCADTTWISYLLHELAIPSSSPTLLLCDNLSTTYMAINPVFYARTKHIELDYHFIQERILSFSHRVHFVSSTG
ncbi:unnamed protein product [Prunus brigantina]